MSFITIFLTAIGLAMDTFAVSICNGMQIGRAGWHHMMRFGLFFGIFQSLMTTAGYMIGSVFRSVIQAWDHWIALVLLAGIGGKMLWDAAGRHRDEEACACSGRAPGKPDLLPFRMMLVLAVATSMDALAVGISFSVVRMDLTVAVITIGAVALVLSAVGVRIGQRLGQIFERWAERVGGVLLIGIGIKIFVEHLVQRI